MKDFLLLILKKTGSVNKLSFSTQSAFLILALLFIACLGLFTLNQIFKQEILKNTVHPYPEIRLSDYPSLQKSIPPEISAQGAFILDDESKVALFQKNENLRFSMASTTKIMTALVALENYKMDDVLTVNVGKVDGVTVGFTQGEKIRFEDMLYAMLLPSGNDAAVILAQNYPQGEKAFVAAMNKKAKDLHLVDTHFADSSGLLDDGDYTTVRDLARLASVALQNPVFAKVVSTRSKTISNLEGTKTYELHNLNRLLGENGVSGVKTGFTDEAGGVLVTAVSKQGKRLIVVVMKSQDRFSDTQKLLSFIRQNLEHQTIRP